MAGRGRAYFFAAPRKPTSDESPETTKAPAVEAPRPRGHSVLPRVTREDHVTGDGSKKCPSFASEKLSTPLEKPPKGMGRGRAFFFRSEASSSGDTNVSSDLQKQHVTEETQVKAGYSSESEIHLSDTSNASKPRGMGRAHLFGSKTKASVSPSSEDTEVSSNLQKLCIKEETQVQTRKSSVTEKPPPVMRHGISGTTVDVSCNYVKLEYINEDRAIWEYEVKFKPEVDDKRAKFKLCNRHFYTLGGNAKVYDGGSRLWTPMRTEKEISSTFHELNYGQEIEVIFQRKCVKKFSECHQILNVIFQRIKGALQLVRLKRGDYNPHLAHKMPEYNLTVWPGYITTVEEFEGGILLNCDISHRVLRTNTIYDIIKDVFNMQRKKGRNETNFEQDLMTALLGMSVITNYNNRTVRIDDIDFDKNPMSTFEKNGKQITYVEYYRTHYKIEIEDTGQPLLVSRVKRKPQGKEDIEILNHFIPELCSPTGYTNEQRENRKLQKEIAGKIQKSPAARAEDLKKFLEGIHANEECSKMLADWGLKVPREGIRIPARTLQPETIRFKNSEIQEPTADWGRALARSKILKAVNLERWFIVYFNRDKKIADTLWRWCSEISPKYDIRVRKPEFCCLQDDRPRTYCDRIRKIADDYPDKCEMICLIFPSKRDDRYDAVKKLVNVDLGIPSQVVISSTLSRDPRRLEPVVTKLFLQMQSKLGGALWGVNIPHQQEGIMFCGIDVYHEAGHRSASIISLVATTNPSATTWTSVSARHLPGQEISDCISNLYREVLNVWYKMNGKFVKQIVTFRDGVGDGQLGVVRDFEVPQIRRVFEHVYDDNELPKLTYIVVQKRINTRFLTAAMNRKTISFDNPSPGTVVDHTSTRRDWYDFFLVSQNVRQGTVAPTHYVVVEDSSGFTTDQIQKLTYKMTHLYYNWTGTVRVPAPCQYAHRLAYHIGEHIHASAHENLRDTLFFL